MRTTDFLSRLPLGSILAGSLWAGAFPTFGMPVLAWLAPASLLLASAATSPKDHFKRGYVAGLVHFLISLHWLLYIPFPSGAIAGWLALGAYLALFPAAWCWICWRFAPLQGAKTPPCQSLPAPESPAPTRFFCLHALLDLAHSAWHQRVVWGVFCAVAWVASELLMAHLLTGFPWNFLGSSQYQSLPLIQIASVTGVYGVSFQVAWVSLGILCAGSTVFGMATRSAAAQPPQTHPASNQLWLPLSDLALPLLGLAGCLALGISRMTQGTTPGREIRVALVQPSIPQTLLFDVRETTNRFNKLIDLSTLAMAAKPDLLIWPEAATPGLLRFESTTVTAIARLLKDSKTSMILGADDAEPIPETPDPNDARYYNSAFLLNPNGEIAGTYRKQRLVMFGEYVPLIRWLPFLRFLTPLDGGFESGTGPAWFTVREPHARAGILICFEDAFPHSVRKAVDDETDFLLNLTNDGWFGESPAQWQHAVCSVFRAVENQLPVIRCTNNGLTCWIDAFGRMHDVYFGDSTDVYGAGIKTARVPLSASPRKRTLSFYTRHGDLFAWTCVTITGAALALSRRMNGPSERGQLCPREPDPSNSRT